nr:uncharacterized protein LOC128701639 [Cherax quadricarinatus]
MCAAEDWPGIPRSDIPRRGPTVTDQNRQDGRRRGRLWSEEVEEMQREVEHEGAVQQLSASAEDVIHEAEKDVPNDVEIDVVLETVLQEMFPKSEEALTEVTTGDQVQGQGEACGSEERNVMSAWPSSEKGNEVIEVEVHNEEGQETSMAEEEVSRKRAAVTGLEQVWNQHFESLFMNLPNMWTFGPIDDIPAGWSIFKDMAKVRFSCQRCSHGWTSMYGLVIFYYQWDLSINQGNVRFLLTGQKCNQCCPPGFETPMWYPEEAQKVMTNLYHEVAGRVYHLQTPPLIRDRRHGRPRHQHNSTMCEACHQGLCKTTRPTSL